MRWTCCGKIIFPEANNSFSESLKNIADLIFLIYKFIFILGRKHILCTNGMRTGFCTTPEELEELETLDELVELGTLDELEELGTLDELDELETMVV